MCGQDIICTVNVVHNCFSNGCDQSASVPIWQECQKTTYTRPTVRHYNPNDLYLNTSQMRDAIHVQPFRFSPAPINREAAIMEGATAEFKAQSAAPKKGKKKAVASRSEEAPISQNVNRSVLAQPARIAALRQPGQDSSSR